MRPLPKDASETIRVLRRLTFLVLLIPLLCFAAAAWKDRSAILKTAESDSIKIVALLREQAGNLFAGHQIILDMIVNRVSDLDWNTIQSRTGLLRELEIMDKRLDGASEILLVDASGQVRATTVHSEPNELPPTADRRCFLELSRNEVETCISQPYADPAAGHYLFSLSQRLTKDGKFNGIAQVAISADYIVGLWASATPSASDIVTMFKLDGTVLAQSGPQSPAGPSLPDLGKFLIGKIGQNDMGIIRAPLFDGGVDRITVYAKVSDEPVYISISLDRGAILETWYTNLTIYGLVAASAMAGIIVAFGLALRRAQSERQAVSLWQAEIEERAKTQEQLRQSQKMEGLGKLTGGIAHDFNNLLTVIVGNLGMVKQLLPPGKAQDYVKNALKAGDSAVQLTARLLAFARKQVLEPRAVDLPQLVDGMENLLLRTLGPDIKLRMLGDPGFWPALVDPNQIELILLNLAINARDAMPKGGTLTISAANGEFGPGAPPDLARGQYVVLTVSDTGIGMDAATLAQATEPFFSTKEVGKGTGLGLSIMQGVITQSGGATRLRSQPGCGTQIEMWLPRARTLPEELKIPSVQDYAPDRGAILVCDDDSAVLQFVCHALETKGYQVFPVTNGEAAVSTLETNKSIRMLVVDFTMPGMNGAAVIKASQGIRPDLPVLLVTGNADPEAIQNDLPDVDMLLKPFDHEVLTRRVTGMLKAAGGSVAADPVS
jgi:signal transduction histidine kinase/CheY-like chemotaxis protein